MIDEKAFKAAMEVIWQQNVIPRGLYNSECAIKKGFEAYEAAKSQSAPMPEASIDDVANAIWDALTDAIPSGRNDSFCDLSNGTKRAWTDIAAKAAIACIKPTLDKSVSIKQDENYFMQKERLASAMFECHRADMGEDWYRKNDTWESLSELGKKSFYMLADSALSTMRPTKPVSGWQPIETAPKDGTKVDLYSVDRKERYPDCKWLKNEWHYWGLDGFDNMDWVRLGKYENPSHWMPLPSLPKQESSK